uniref:Uncharacterized protein n=1 Tax=Globodera pallida TaxID=36090 RepID=A0A183C0Z9_GLOPA
MNLWEIDVNEFLRCGIDPNIVVAVQLLRTLSVDGASSSSPPVLSADGPFPSIFNGSSSLLSPDVTEQQMFCTVRHAVCCCAFFHGFETISDTAADRLATTVVNKLDGMAKQLHTLADQQKRSGRRPTPASKNPVHQVLECHALPSSVLLNFYKTRVVQPCQTVAEKYIASQKSEHFGSECKEKKKQHWTPFD